MNIKNLPGPQSTDQYQNFTFLKSGGMGEVYTAYDTVNGSIVAVKLIRDNNYSNSEQLESEFSIAKSLVHPNIIQTYYSGSDTIDNVNYHYAVMEFVDGGNLETHLKNVSRPLPIEDALTIMLQLAEGLAQAHTKIVHRDLKPQNILFTKSGIVKICDFGISKLVFDATRTHTFKGYGTIAYMAPECWTQESNTPAMDVYSLGILSYEMLTGNLPFLGRSEAEFKNKHLFEPFPDITRNRSDLPVKLVQIISKMTEKRALNRYKNGQEVYEALQNLSLAGQDSTSIPAALLSKANSKINQIKTQEILRTQQEEEAKMNALFLDHSIDSLFRRIEAMVNLVNNSLEQEKIKVQNFRNKLNLSFFNKSLNISFFREDSIQNYIDSRNESSRSAQVANYGMIMNPPSETHLVKDGVKLVGILESVPRSSFAFGANLLLLKSDPTDLYGDWYCCWFDDSAFARQNFQHYPLENNDFFNEYEIGRSRAMHIRTMQFSQLNDEIISTFIEHLVD